MIRTRIPYVASVGAVDTITFGAKETVPEQYRNRLSQMHNANITLVRTTIEENRIARKWLAERLNMMEGPVRLLIPEGGLSQLDAPGMPFHDPQANGALFDAIEETIVQTEDRQVLRVPCHINDPRFADQVVASFKTLLGLGNGGLPIVLPQTRSDGYRRCATGHPTRRHHVPREGKNRIRRDPCMHLTRIRR